MIYTIFVIACCMSAVCLIGFIMGTVADRMKP